MAYLVRDARSRSPYWYGVYLVVSPGGQRLWVRKSTGLNEDFSDRLACRSSSRIRHFLPPHIQQKSFFICGFCSE